mmetsp:Transcript_20889/g.39703  ORF Transcript_20889/g.39703 Transcript_20889/m.39703 type:complete len:516 (+) Transcript_20889:1120-2667(+)
MWVLSAPVEPVTCAMMHIHQNFRRGPNLVQIPSLVQLLGVAGVFSPSLKRLGGEQLVALKDFGAYSSNDDVRNCQKVLLLDKQRSRLSYGAPRVVRQHPPRQAGAVVPVVLKRLGARVEVRVAAHHGAIQIAHHHHGRPPRPREWNELPVHQLVPARVWTGVEPAARRQVVLAVAVGDGELERGLLAPVLVGVVLAHRRQLHRVRRHLLPGQLAIRHGGSQRPPLQVPGGGRHAHAHPALAGAVSHRHLGEGLDAVGDVHAREVPARLVVERHRGVRGHGDDVVQAVLVVALGGLLGGTAPLAVHEKLVVVGAHAQALAQNEVTLIVLLQPRPLRPVAVGARDVHHRAAPFLLPLVRDRLRYSHLVVEVVVLVAHAGLLEGGEPAAVHFELVLVRSGLQRERQHKVAVGRALNRDLLPVVERPGEADLVGPPAAVPLETHHHRHAVVAAAHLRGQSGHLAHVRQQLLLHDGGMQTVVVHPVDARAVRGADVGLGAFEELIRGVLRPLQVVRGRHA